MDFNISKEDEDKSGIYKITNSINKKIYVGSAVNFRKRSYGHVYDFQNKKHNKRFQNFVNKYGLSCLSFKLIEIIEDTATLLEREQFFIDFFQSFKSKLGFNVCPIAGSTLGVKMPDSHRKATKTRMKGNQYFKGFGHSAEIKEKISQSSKGRKWTEDQRKQMSILKKGICVWNEDTPHPMKGRIHPCKGKPIHTEEAKEKFSKAKMGEKNPMFGKKKTQEQLDSIRKKVKQLDKNKQLIKVWNSMQETKDGGFSPCNIYKAIHGIYGKILGLYKGFYWEYS